MRLKGGFGARGRLVTVGLGLAWVALTLVVGGGAAKGSAAGDYVNVVGEWSCDNGAKDRYYFPPLGGARVYYFGSPYGDSDPPTRLLDTEVATSDVTLLDGSIPR